MLLLRKNEWKLVDIVDKLFMFKNLRHENEFYLAKAVKLLDPSVNESVVYDFDRLTSAEIDSLLDELRKDSRPWVTLPKKK